jgi:hypothetical protein
MKSGLARTARAQETAPSARRERPQPQEYGQGLSASAYFHLVPLRGWGDEGNGDMQPHDIYRSDLRNGSTSSTHHVRRILSVIDSVTSMLATLATLTGLIIRRLVLLIALPALAALLLAALLLAALLSTLVLIRVLILVAHRCSFLNVPPESGNKPIASPFLVLVVQ